MIVHFLYNILFWMLHDIYIWCYTYIHAFVYNNSCVENINALSNPIAITILSISWCAHAKVHKYCDFLFWITAFPPLSNTTYFVVLYRSAHPPYLPTSCSEFKKRSRCGNHHKILTLIRVFNVRAMLILTSTRVFNVEAVLIV